MLLLAAVEFPVTYPFISRDVVKMSNFFVLLVASKESQIYVININKIFVEYNNSNNNLKKKGI